MTFTTEHEKKYEELAQRIGIEALKRIVPATAERVKAALANGDEPLNTIPLMLWDRRAGLVSLMAPVRLSWSAPWLPDVASGLSLAERVCVLKHVAKYHLLVEEVQL